jgi:hypothetical protein
MPTLRSRHVRSTDAVLLVTGVGLVAGSGALAISDGQHETAVLALAVGAGLCVSVAATVRTARVRAAVLVALLTAFVAWRVGVLVADATLAFGNVMRVVTEGLIVAVVYQLAYAQAHGLAQVATLFRGGEAGYALVLDESAAARKVEAELARSRRNGTPLTFLVLEPTIGSAGRDFEAVVSRLSSRALVELERLYMQERSSRRISEQLRRSDVVVCSSAERFLVLSTDTSAAGTAILANRVVDTVRAELGIELRTGIAEFPSDGSTYGDLIAIATSAARGHVASPLSVAPVVASVDLDEAELPRVEANP